MRIRDLPAADYKTILDIVNDTSGAESLGEYAPRLIGHLRRVFPFPIALFAYNTGFGPRLVPVDTREPSDGALRESHPVVYSEQAGFCALPPRAPVAIASRTFSRRVLADFATTQEYWPQYGVRDSAALFFTTRAGYHGALSVCTESQDASFLDHLAAFLRELAPYVSSTVDGLLRLDDLRIRSATLDAVTQVEEGAVILVAEDGRAIWMSAPARALLRSLQVDGERLPPVITDRCARIWAAYRESGESQIGAMEPQILTLRTRRVIARYLLIRGSPGAQIMIHIDDRGGKAWSAFETRAAHFGLTGRERQVALGVVEGLANKEIADWLRITLQTVKNHLKSVFHKTACRCRVDVVRLFAGSPGWDGQSGLVGT